MTTKQEIKHLSIEEIEDLFDHNMESIRQQKQELRRIRRNRNRRVKRKLDKISARVKDLEPIVKEQIRQDKANKFAKTNLGELLIEAGIVVS